jgi:flagellar FliL protein
MKMALIGLVAVLILGGGAAGAYFYFNKPAEAALTEGAEAEKAAAAEGEHAAPAPVLEFVKIDPIILPVIDDHGLSQVVTIVITLEVPDVAAADQARLMAPRLKDAIIQDMYGVLSRKSVMKGETVDVTKIKARLNELSKKVLGTEKVNDVLLQVVNQRPV